MESVFLKAALLLFAFNPLFFGWVSAQDSLESVVDRVQPRVVKLYGSGGFRGLEPYQTGTLISNNGYVLTVWSYVLDTDELVATLHDGEKFEARLVGFDPRLEIAVLKIDATDLPFFNVESEVNAKTGMPVLAFSNLFRVATGDEPASVLRGVITTVVDTNVRQVIEDSVFRGKVLILDAITNNPGAAGGVLTDSNGNWLGLIGKERKGAHTGEWLNYAIPITELRDSVLDMLAGKMAVVTKKEGQPSEPMTLEFLGLTLVPEIVRKTPAYVDRIRVGLPAEQAGIRPDDLIVEIQGRMTSSIEMVKARLNQLDRDSVVKLTVQRENQLLEFELRAR